MREHNMTTFGIVRASIIILLLCRTSLGFALEDGAEPPGLSALRQDYEREIVRATENIRSKYIAQLGGLQNSLAVKGDLDAALAVGKEKERISQISTPAQLAQMQAITGLEITKATYGSDSKKINVTNPVRDLQVKEASGRLVIPVSFRQDPDWGTAKQLIVTYKYKGKECTVTASEGDCLLLPDGNIGKLPVR